MFTTSFVDFEKD